MVLPWCGNPILLFRHLPDEVKNRAQRPIQPNIQEGQNLNILQPLRQRDIAGSSIMYKIHEQQHTPHPTTLHRHQTSPALPSTLFARPIPDPNRLSSLSRRGPVCSRSCMVTTGWEIAWLTTPTSIRQPHYVHSARRQLLTADLMNCSFRAVTGFVLFFLMMVRMNSNTKDNST